ncbi:hypothetical protein OKW96_16480 [Sphingobacterium sp. KU25419]|nr:hypothetical protein OKW96_16480 [Sphingobacterium sp. KU25419]
MHRGGLVIGAAALLFYVSYAAVKKKDALKFQLLMQRAVTASHLTHNVLNFIYNDTLEKAPNSSKAIELLSLHLQQTMQTPHVDGLIPLIEEKENIERFIDTMELTAPGRRHVRFISDLEADSTEEIRVPPNLLVNIVDNVYRHGNLSDTAMPGNIFLHADKNKLYFQCENQKSKTSKSGYGIGLVDTRFLLNYAFGKNNWVLNIADEPETFNLKLEIWMKP